MTEYNWCSREEWAERSRSVYSDMTEGVRFGPSAVSTYASPEEIEQAFFELKCQWSRCGFKMREGKKKAGPLLQQPGESDSAYLQRYYTMTEAEQDLAFQPDRFQRERKVINQAIRALRDDELITTYCINAYPDSFGGAFATLLERYDALWQQEFDQFVEKVANTPIDDAAWEAELQRRREIENPTIERVNVGFRKATSTG